jgi:hypothetical protein
MSILKKLGNAIMKGMYAHAENMQETTRKDYWEVFRQFDTAFNGNVMNKKKAA